MEQETGLVEKVKAWPASVMSYIGELQLEMRRVTWPAWKQVRATTGVVILAVFAFAAYFAVVDTIVGSMIKRVFETFTKAQ